MNNISTLDKDLSDRNERLLYCSIDGSVTADLWKSMKTEINASAEKAKVNNVFDRYNSLMVLHKKILSNIWTLNSKINKSKARKLLADRKKQKNFNIGAKPKLVEMGVIKKKEPLDIKKLRKLSNHSKKTEDRELCKLLLDDVKTNGEIKTLEQISNQIISFYCDFTEYEFKLRSNTVNFSIDDVFLISDTFDFKHEKIDLHEKIYDVLEIDKSDPIIENWLNGDGPVVTARSVSYKTKEIKEMFAEYDDKYSSISDKIDQCFLSSYETGWITNPWTNNSFRCESTILENKLKKILFNDIILSEMLSLTKDLDNDKMIIINGSKLILETS